VAAGLLQLDGQIGQFLGVGGIVAYHILHQSQQLFHGGVLAVRGAAGAIVVAVVVMMFMGVGMTVVMEVFVIVGMLMIVLVSMIVGMGVGNTVMGMFMGVGMGMLVAVIAGADMVVMQMHRWVSFRNFFFIIQAGAMDVKTFIFPEISPRRACAAANYGV